MIYLYLFGTCFHFIYVFMIIGNKDNLNDIRQFVRYMKAKKQYFNYFKKNA